jgi:hypothetical protein
LITTDVMRRRYWSLRLRNEWRGFDFPFIQKSRALDDRNNDNLVLFVSGQSLGMEIRDSSALTSNNRDSETSDLRKDLPVTQNKNFNRATTRSKHILIS